MTKIAYLECPTGIAGDMCLGALISAGVPLDYLQTQLSRLGIAQEYHLWTELVHRNGQQATRMHVDLASQPLMATAEVAKAAAPSHSPAPSHSHDQAHPHDHPHSHDHHHPPDLSHTHDHPHAHDPSPHPMAHAHTQGRHLPEIEHLIQQAHLPTRAAAWSLAVFRTLAVAEGAVHGIAPEQVHFHEVGATDAIVDIVGTCLGFDWLGVEQIYCSPLPTGGGTIRAAHGQLPVPAPAVLKLWEMGRVPIYSNGIDRELVTPTGAALAVTLASQFGPPPAMTLHQVGLGAGGRELPLPNILRLWLGEAQGAAATALRTQSFLPAQPQPAQPHTEPITILETQVDDLSPQAIGYLFEALFAVGAVDVFTQAIGMKKSRPGVLVTVLCHPVDQAACEAVLFRETTTLGIRYRQQQRMVLQRAFETVETSYGPVRVKVSRAGQQADPISTVQPEYEDCAQIARQQGVAWREVHRLALQAWYEQHPNMSFKS